MKKLWSFILMFAFVVTLCACNSTQGENMNSSPVLLKDPESAQQSANSQTEDDTASEQLLQRLRCTFEDGSVGYIDNLTDTVTTREFVGLLPMEITLSDWDQREYYISRQLSYDEADAQTSYAPGEFTYWCGGWITAYYDTNEDTVIEAGSVVIGMMDEIFLGKLKGADGASITVRIEADTGITESAAAASQIEEENNTGKKQGDEYTSWDDVPVNEYREETITVDYNGQTIWGVAFIPELDREKYPLVICSHGLGGSYTSCMEYAELMASHGLATYCFDFRGGGGSHSDGNTTEMSLITEATDIQTVIAAAKQWNFVDSDKIILLGESQGGAASAIAAARSTDDVNGLILCYPALLVHDAVHERFDSLDEVPDTYYFNWITAGRPYAADVWDYDVYSEIGNYQKPVLLMHGDRDGVVPISYAKRAAEVYPDVEYYVISGGGHGFYGNSLDDAFSHIFEYLQNISIL